MPRNRRIYVIIFITLVLLFFVPSIPRVADFMTNVWTLSLAIYWVILTVIAMFIGLKVIKGVEQW